MRTLYLRNVPDEVVARLERLADREGMSVSSLAVKELSSASLRADNGALLGALPDLGIEPQVLLDALDQGRAGG